MQELIKYTDYNVYFIQTQYIIRTWNFLVTLRKEIKNQWINIHFGSLQAWLTSTWLLNCEKKHQNHIRIPIPHVPKLHHVSSNIFGCIGSNACLVVFLCLVMRVTCIGRLSPPKHTLNWCHSYIVEKYECLFLLQWVTYCYSLTWSFRETKILVCFQKIERQVLYAFKIWIWILTQD